MSKKSKITFNKPPEPEFMRKMKEKVGWKDDGPTVETKREIQILDDFVEEPEDESPTVVVLTEGHLTKEEADEVQRDLDLDDKRPGKFQFKKPKESSKSTGLTASSVKRACDATLNKSEKKMRVDDKKPHSKLLLSFCDDEEDN